MQRLLHLLEAQAPCRLHVVDLEEVPAECGLNRFADRALGEAENRLARAPERAVGPEVGDRQHARTAAFEVVGHDVEQLALRQPLRAFPDQCLVLGIDLHHRALLRHVELVDPRLVFGVDVFVAQLDLRDHGLRCELHDHRGTPLGRHEGCRVRLVVFAERGLVRLREAGHAAGGDQRDLCAALFRAVAVDGFDQRFRHLALAADGVQELTAEDVDADQVLVLGPGHVVALEHQIVELGVEPPLLVAEGRRTLQLLHHARVGRPQAEPAGLGVQQVLAHEDVEHLPRETGAVGLVAGQIGAAGALPLALQGALELPVEQDRRYVDVAHGRHRRAAPAGEHVVDAEGAEAQRQDDDDAAGRP